MTTTTAGSGDAMALPQGDIGLLESDIARRLLSSTIPARLAYLAMDGTPRAVPIWVQRSGDEIVMATFATAPKIEALRMNPDVAITVDTEVFPPSVLSVRGKVSVTDVDGVVAEYALAARRYLGEEDGGAYIAQLAQQRKPMVRIALRPSWVGVFDFQTRIPKALGGAPG